MVMAWWCDDDVVCCGSFCNGGARVVLAVAELSSDGEDGSRTLPVCPASIVLLLLDSGDDSPPSPNRSLLGPCSWSSSSSDSSAYT